MLPTTINVNPPVPVQQFCRVPEGDVNSFLDQQGGGVVASPVQHPGLFPQGLDRIAEPGPGD